LVGDLFELRPLALRDGDAFEEEPPVPGLGADVRQAQEIERLRPSQSTLGPSVGREAAELDQACLVPMQFQPELGKPLPQVGQELLGITEILEPSHEIVSEPHNDHVTARMPLPPLPGPPVEHVMEIDVSQQR
jgi:hypothetical protein